MGGIDSKHSDNVFSFCFGVASAWTPHRARGELSSCNAIKSLPMGENGFMLQYFWGTLGNFKKSYIGELLATP
jgi:hypothetical protein